MKNEFLEFFDVDLEKGLFIWKKKTNSKIVVGAEAGSVVNTGRRLLSFKGKRYLASRVLWLIKTGSWPVGVIDHINGNPLDNRIENLRDVSIRENSSNLQCHRNGKLVGTTYNKKCKKWYSCYYVNGKTKFLGAYDTEIEAHNSYLGAIK